MDEPIITIALDISSKLLFFLKLWENGIHGSLYLDVLPEINYGNGIHGNLSLFRYSSS